MTSSIGIEAYDEEHREVIELGNCGRFSETSANQPLSHRAPTGIGRRHTNALAHAGQTERTVLLEEPETLDVELLRGGGKPRRRPRRRRPDPGSTCSQTGHG